MLSLHCTYLIIMTVKFSISLTSKKSPQKKSAFANQPIEIPQQLQKYQKLQKKAMQIPVQNPQSDNPVIPDFIRKLHSMIQTEPEVISFSEDGCQVHIHDYNMFVMKLLPKYFRHSKWRSFIRQMNMYSFRKLNRGMKTYIFVNPIFRRGNQSNFGRIRRKNHTKQQQQDAQINLQTELKHIVAVQCRMAGIPHSQSSQFHPTYSSNTLPSLTGPIQNHGNLQQQQPYSNSVLQFLTKILNQRKKTLAICQDIKQNMEFITKQRKNIQNKNIMNTVKDSMQMIEQISGKFREKMEVFVDQRHEIVQDDWDMGAMGFVAGGSNGGVGGHGELKSAGKKIKQKSNSNKQDNNINQLVSFSSTSSINPIIPQPITKPQQSQTREPVSRTLTNGPTTNNNPNHNLSHNHNPNQNHNQLGLTNYCSFSSVTHFINFDRQ